MIAYEAFGDGEVIIKASVVATTFSPSTGWELTPQGTGKAPEGVKIWETKLNPDDFRGYNPFCAVNILHDRLFISTTKQT